MAHKYDVPCMLRYVCCGLRRVLDNESGKILRNVDIHNADNYLSESSKVSACCRICDRYGLEASKKAALSLFDQLLLACEKHSVSKSAHRHEMKGAVADFVVRLSPEGDNPFAFQIAVKALRSMGC